MLYLNMKLGFCEFLLSSKGTQNQNSRLKIRSNHYLDDCVHTDVSLRTGIVCIVACLMI